MHLDRRQTEYHGRQTLTQREGAPDWARRMKRQQSLQHGLSTAAHVIRSGDHGGGGTVVSLSERSS